MCGFKCNLLTFRAKINIFFQIGGMYLHHTFSGLAFFCFKNRLQLLYKIEGVAVGGSFTFTNNSLYENTSAEICFPNSIDFSAYCSLRITEFVHYGVVLHTYG